MDTMRTQILTALISVLLTLFFGRVINWWNKPRVDWLLLPVTKFIAGQDSTGCEINHRFFSEHTIGVSSTVTVLNAGDATAYDVRWIHPDGRNEFLASILKPGDQAELQYYIAPDLYKTGTLGITFLAAPVRRSDVLQTEFACVLVGTQAHLKSKPEGALKRIRRSIPATIRASLR